MASGCERLLGVVGEHVLQLHDQRLDFGELLVGAALRQSRAPRPRSIADAALPLSSRPRPGAWRRRKSRKRRLKAGLNCLLNDPIAIRLRSAMRKIVALAKAGEIKRG
jgi:hypothetical protein